MAEVIAGGTQNDKMGASELCVFVPLRPSRRNAARHGDDIRGPPNVEEGMMWDDGLG
jgi:hypothetical protein